MIVGSSPVYPTLTFKYSRYQVEDGVIWKGTKNKKVAHPANFHRTSDIPEDVFTKKFYDKIIKLS